MQQKSPQSGADFTRDEQVRVLQLALQKKFILNGYAVAPKAMRLRHIISYHVTITIQSNEASFMEQESTWPRKPPN